MRYYKNTILYRSYNFERNGPWYWLNHRLGNVPLTEIRQPATHNQEEPREKFKNFRYLTIFVFCETDLFVQLRVAEYLEENMSAEFYTEARSLSDETSHLVCKTVVPVHLTDSQQLL